MRWSIRIAKIAGTEVKLHVTFLLLLAFYGYFFYQSAGFSAMVEGLSFILVLFLCVLLHEFGHALAAKSYGIRTPDITLLPIGGVARLERMPDKPLQELVVALAGPAVNVAIIIGLGVVMWDRLATTGTDLLSLLFRPLTGDLLLDVFRVNIILVIFNMIPAFPMDGGRVLRSLLATQLSYTRATEIAATVGQGLAIVFGFLGLISSPINIILILIAFFVWIGASQESAVAGLRDLSSGLPVDAAMIREFRTLDQNAVLSDAVEALLSTSQHEFPITDQEGQVLGILTRRDMIKALRDKGDAIPVVEIMQTGIPVVQSRSSFERAFYLMQDCGCPALPVVDASGRLVGMITPENVGEMIMISSAMVRRRRTKMP